MLDDNPLQNEKKSVSFIIPHKGRETLLIQTIQSILELDYPSSLLEVIIVTQNKSLEHPFKNQAPFPIRIIFSSPRHTIAKLRNDGARQASGQFLAFIDADIKLSKNWIKVMIETLKARPGCLLAGSIQQYEPEAGIIEKIRVILGKKYANCEVDFLPSANLFIKKSVFMESGRFPEAIATCEDYYFTNKLRAKGKLYSTSEANFIHLGEDRNYRELFKKEIWRSQANLKTIKERKLTPRELPSLLTPLWQAFFFIGLFFTLAVNKDAAWTLIFLLFIFLPVILYAIRLFKNGKPIIGFMDTLQFYTVYQAARVIGTFFGLFQRI